MFVLQPASTGDAKLRVLVLSADGIKEMDRRFEEHGPKPLPPQSLSSSMFMEGFY
jgi:hypothetical protein